MTVKERLIKFLEVRKISKSEFGRRIGVSSAFITSMRQSMQPDKVKRIALEFPDLNTEWLLTGEGEMLKAPQNPFSQMPSQQIEEIAAKTFTERLMEAYRAGEIYPAEVHNRIVAEKDKRIEELQRENWELQKKIDDLSK